MAAYLTILGRPGRSLHPRPPVDVVRRIRDIDARLSGLADLIPAPSL
jgi:hypothetical protein